jgi:GAF domain-containing protein
MGIVGSDKEALYKELCDELAAILKGERDLVANAANTAALVFHRLDHVNWVGFYLLRGDELVLGPFQGKPACVRIPLGKGVCGTAARQKATVIVPDVHAFRGHIACDAASQSEIVLPIMDGERLVGVFDLDSPVVGRFDSQDGAGLQQIIAEFQKATCFTR